MRVSRSIVGCGSLCLPVPSDSRPRRRRDEDKGRRLACIRSLPSVIRGAAGVRGAARWKGTAMTGDRARKRAVRARMAATGEPYSVAARHVADAAAGVLAFYRQAAEPGDILELGRLM